MRPGRTHTWHIMRHPGWKGEGVVVVTAKAPRLHTRRSLSVPPSTPPPPLTPPTTTTAYHPRRISARRPQSIMHSTRILKLAPLHPAPHQPASESRPALAADPAAVNPILAAPRPRSAPKRSATVRRPHHHSLLPPLAPPIVLPFHRPMYRPRTPRGGSPDHNSRPHPDLSQTASPTHAPPL